MQATGNLVGILVEFTAGVQLGHDHFSRRNAFLGVNIDRDTATVVLHRNRTVVVQDDQRAVTMPGEGLVDGIVDDFVDHVVQARAIIGIADVHARPLAYSVQPAKDFDAVRAVFVLLFFSRHGVSQSVTARVPAAAVPKSPVLRDHYGRKTAQFHRLFLEM